ncbi:chondroitin sulfate proteoglycan 5 isoform X7 [Onychostoma macrolepis]|uniref:chondroitin sulfate proteoglycan 5 isoform X7 n=1 Tax=Onychostoma macrolepis TaxID=369639 RepID=UPI00272BC961|nr:chondroitin sulfate proteoglycan 5 isoform X7 [Onychostoma macrolepis]
MEAVKVGQRFTDVEARGKEKGKMFKFSILPHVTPLVRSLHEEVVTFPASIFGLMPQLKHTRPACISPFPLPPSLTSGSDRSLIGNSVVGNETEVDSAVNVTSLSTGDEEEKIEEVSQFTSLSSSSDLTRTGRKFRDEEAGSGMLEEVFQPTPGTPTSSEGATTTLASPEISSESAETENLLLHEPVSTSFVKEHVTPFMEEEEQESEEEVRQQVPTLPPWQDAKEDTETTVFDLDSETTPTTPSPTHPPSPADVTVDFFDLGSRRKNLGPPSQSPHELQGRDPTSWSMPDNYDYMTPYDDSVSPTTEDYPYSSTTDSYDDDISTTSPSKRFPPRLPSNPVFTLPKGSTVGAGPRAPPGVVDSVNGSECRQGFVRTNGSCKSPCDLQPNYCLNGGQCYVMEGAQMFCRCNIQDYMWHKGARCESVITEFQVMCIAIGASAFMVLLLFMIVVCFAKKLHVLKTENNKLRKRSSKYRPSSEHHNDNFSLSTIAEGSHPNDDPNTQNKLEDPVKAPPPKEDESLNIQNSLTPKHENHKVLGEENSSEVNSLQNNMM